MDVTALATADPEFMNISSDLRNAANYGGKIMAIPYAVYYFGYFINKTIFDNGNADFPVFTDTWAQFISKIEDVANHAPTNGSGIAGLFGIDRILEWYPAQINPDLGWFTYDGTLLHIDGSEFETALNLYKTLLADKTLVLESMDGTEQEAAFGAGGTWERSKLAAFWTESYNIGSMLDLEFSIDFIGTPGVTSHKIPVILDLMCISSQTDHPEEAFLLAKWMSFGKEGYLKRIDISTNVEGVTALNMTPLQPDVEMLDAFFGIYQGFTEFRKVVEYSDYIIEPNKYVPGYIPARWTKEYNETFTLGEIFDLVRTGEITFADVKTNWNTLANGELNTSRTAVFDKLGVD
jgi:multiple sugar transport system substrate-binding protein